MLKTINCDGDFISLDFWFHSTLFLVGLFIRLLSRLVWFWGIVWLRGIWFVWLRSRFVRFWCIVRFRSVRFIRFRSRFVSLGLRSVRFRGIWLVRFSSRFVWFCLLVLIFARGRIESLYQFLVLLFSQEWFFLLISIFIRKSFSNMMELKSLSP